MDLCRELYSLICDNLNQITALRNTAVLKADNTPVSKGDLLCQKLITEFITAKLPDCIVISEEIKNDVSHLSDYEYVATIDPIDGTENFVCGMPEWGFGVSIYHNMQHFQSILALPEMGLCLISGDKIDRHTGSRICAISSHVFPEEIAELGEKGHCRVTGCSMYSMYCVITGRFRKYCHWHGNYSWDMLPGLNIALENGLYVEVEGKPYHGEFLLPDIRYRFCVENR